MGGSQKTIGVITGIIFIVILIVVILNIISGMSTSITDAGDAVTNPNNCSDANDVNFGNTPAVYNITDGYCYNDSSVGGGKGYEALEYQLPLRTLYGSSGVILLVLMASLLILLIGVSLYALKRKK